MPLNPQTRTMLDAFAGGSMMDGLKAIVAARSEGREPPSMMPPIPAEPVAAIDDRLIDGAAGSIAARFYTPAGPGPFPVTVYFHGGGFVTGDLDMYDATCSRIANRAGSVVVSVDYRLAPETRFPGAADDAMAALRWIHANAARFAGDARRIAVAGDSAGGNLAAVAAQQARAAGIALRHQLLIYPVLDFGADTPSIREYGPKAYLLSDEMMRWFCDQYLPDPGCILDPRASPLRAPDLRNLPAATIVTAEYDPLRDEGEAYADRLLRAGVPTTLRRWDGQVHGFAALFGMLDDAQAAIDFASAELRKFFVA
ncbi:hypothetical protein B9N43_15450 [Denitratisoma sp. DHT3]|uniref:alpha/beta hydrolase n=1 Tax=Denitratisoma sp. DHT3 TaxID=1981880 RepID=UPI00119881E5|nr:alpha/beta hydrolase [Denitratisoma sp. DHT3]QDX82506.1 hypothetical protein B9N43_15450 [Denitratisoma sp. DHT3]